MRSWQGKNNTRRNKTVMRQHPRVGAREAGRGQDGTEFTSRHSMQQQNAASAPNKWLSVWGFSVCVCLTFFFSVSSQWCWCDSSVPCMPLSLCLAWTNTLSIFCLIEYLTWLSPVCFSLWFLSGCLQLIMFHCVGLSHASYWLSTKEFFYIV